MKRVVIIGPDFTPSSLPPATRIRLFATHLPKFGWQPTVLSTDPQYYEGTLDRENEKLLPENLEIVRTPAWSTNWTRKIGVGDIGARSIWHHWQVLARICRENQQDLLFLPVPPYIPMILGRLANIRFRLPYIMDYIDPWITEYYWQLPRSQRPPKWLLADSTARCLEPWALKRVSHIVGVSEGVISQVIGRYRHLQSQNTTEIPYGGEAQDLAYLRQQPRRNKIFNKGDGFFHWCHIGACIPSMHNAIKAFFEALRLGFESAPELYCRVRLHFVGNTYAPDSSGKYEILPLAREMGVAEFVTEHPARVPYLDSLQLLLDADGLVVFGTDEAAYAASKLYPYILAQRPLLTIFHEDSNPVRVLRATKAGKVFTFNAERSALKQAEAIRQALTEMLEGAVEPYQPPTDWAAFEPYTAQAMAQKLAQVFDKVLERENELSG